MIGSVTLKDDGVRSEIEARISQVLGSINGTTIDVVAGGSRGGTKNALIARVQTGHLRNPFYLDREAKDAVRFAAGGLSAAQYSTRQRAVGIIGDLMLLAIGRNVEKQQNPNASKFKPLTPAYAAAKRRKFGFVTPILKATNDLLGGLRVRVGKIR